MNFDDFFRLVMKLYSGTRNETGYFKSKEGKVSEVRECQNEYDIILSSVLRFKK